MQIGQFVLPRHGHPVTNDTEVARYLRTTKEQLPAAHVSIYLLSVSFRNWSMR